MMTQNDKETVLITGANGFIGGFLVDEALARGLRVVCTIRKNSNASQLESKGVIVVHLDYSTIDALASVMKQYTVQYVIHNAGLTKSPHEEEYIRANVTLLENIVHACREANIQLRKFVLVSSLAAYGPADFQKEGIVREDSTPHPVTMYGRSKLLGENWLKSQRDLPWSIVRPTVVYGPGEKDLYSVFKMIKQHLDLRPGFVAPKLTFIYVKDLARFILDIAIHGRPHTAFFATDGNVYNGDALYGFIKESLGTWAFSLRIPIPLLSVAAILAEVLAKRKGVYPALNRDKIHEIKARSWVCDVREMSELGFKAEYNLAKGVAETVQWYKKHKWL
jgi:nucleoside-diphosphate-sugar epimerase